MKKLKKTPNDDLTNKDIILILVLTALIFFVCLPLLARFILQWISPVDLLLIALSIISAVFALLALFSR